MEKLKILAAGLSLAMAGAVAYDNTHFRTTEYTISSSKLPQSFEGKKILQLSDLHQRQFGNNQKKLVEQCKKEKPDYIVFTGDLYSRNQSFDEICRKHIFMRELRKTASVYYILGNHEEETLSKAEPFIDLLEYDGINVLRNELSRIYIGDEFINLYGLEIGKEYYKSENNSYRNLPQITADNLDKAFGKAEKDQFNILLAHSPFYFKEYEKWGADLVFSGHCHGGVIRLPVIGGVLSPQRTFFPEYTKGVYRHKNSAMIVSAGLGKFRAFNPAEIVSVTLKADRKKDSKNV
ncbi:MAG: metallophosphoesterase [Oscillospiraceae bacterium]